MPLTEYWSWIANLPHFSTTSLTADVQCDSAMATPYPLSVAGKRSSKPGARRVSVSSHPSTQNMAPPSPAHDCLSPQAQNRLPFPMRDCLGQQTRGKPCANTAVRACRCTPPSYTLNVRGVAAATNSHGASKGRTSTVSVATIYQIWSEGCIAHGVTLARSLRRRGKARWATAAGGGL